MWVRNPVISGRPRIIQIPDKPLRIGNGEVRDHWNLEEIHVPRIGELLQWDLRNRSEKHLWWNGHANDRLDFFWKVYSHPLRDDCAPVMSNEVKLFDVQRVCDG